MIIVLGIAGSGKSTQSRLLANREGLTWLSMGEILRQHITDERRADMLAGKVLDQDEVIAILAPILQTHGDTSDIILDGFPRGLHQAEWLLAQCAQGEVTIEAIIHLHVQEAAAKVRLLARGRQDDTEEAIAERFDEYEHTIKPIITLMSDNDVPILTINAERQPDQVFEDIISKLHDLGVNI